MEVSTCALSAILRPWIAGILNRSWHLLVRGPRVRTLSLAEVEVVLDTTAYIVLQVTATQQLVKVSALRLDLLELELVRQASKLQCPFIGSGAVVELLQPFLEMAAEEIDDRRRQAPLRRQLV